jgi:hypothetical protein
LTFPNKPAKTKHIISNSHCRRCYHYFPRFRESVNDIFHDSQAYRTHKEEQTCHVPLEKGTQSREEYRWYKVGESIHGHPITHVSPCKLNPACLSDSLILFYYKSRQIE